MIWKAGMRGSQLSAVIVLKSGDRNREVTAVNWLEHPESGLWLVNDGRRDGLLLSGPVVLSIGSIPTL